MKTIKYIINVTFLSLLSINISYSMLNRYPNHTIISNISGVSEWEDYDKINQSELINTIEAIAFELNYFTLKDNLRMQTQDLLIEIEKLSESFKANFNLYKRPYQGMEYAQDFNSLYNTLNDNINMVFEQSANTLINKGKTLDRLNAPLSQKISFVNDLKKNISTRINKLITLGNKQIRLIKQINS